MNKRASVQVARREAVAFADAPRVQRVRRTLVSLDGALALAETFSLLGDATRTRILHALSVDELCVSDLAGLLEISASTASHQLRLLRDRRLVAVRREGKRTYYRLQDEHIRTLIDMGVSHAAEDAERRRR
jgi:ArsR family transcriptional regulator, lead/cadmium/zinc/bismuth-responsive transcriptional repressor